MSDDAEEIRTRLATLMVQHENMASRYNSLLNERDRLINEVDGLRVENAELKARIERGKVVS